MVLAFLLYIAVSFSDQASSVLSGCCKDVSSILKHGLSSEFGCLYWYDMIVCIELVYNVITPSCMDTVKYTRTMIV